MNRLKARKAPRSGLMRSVRRRYHPGMKKRTLILGAGGLAAIGAAGFGAWGYKVNAEQGFQASLGPVAIAVWTAWATRV